MNHKAFYPSEELIRILYYDEGKTVAELAEIFDAGQTTVRTWMDRYGLPRRPGAFQPENQIGEQTRFKSKKAS